MSAGFEVSTYSKGGRVDYFYHTDHPEDAIYPEYMGEIIAGGWPEQLEIFGETYNITTDGNVIHQDVTVPDSVIFGNGVRIDRDTIFEDGGEAEFDRTYIGNETRINGTFVAANVKIGKMGAIEARIIGRGAIIGDYVRIKKADTVIEEGVKIAGAVKIGGESFLGRGSVIEFNVNLEPESNVAPGEQVFWTPRQKTKV